MRRNMPRSGAGRRHLVIGGDQLLPGISANIGVYPTEPGADPLAEWLAPAPLPALARPDHLVLPGHKLPFTGLPLRLRQMIENHEGALDRLRAHLRAAPRTPATVSRRSLRRASEPWRRGEVTRRDPDGLAPWSRRWRI
jgi:glyoxylase-like metal-dependent hydrolase (beta-lactamase superfamily II)